MIYTFDRLPAFSAVETSASAAGIPLDHLKNLRLLYDRIEEDSRLCELTVAGCNALSAKKCPVDFGKAFFDRETLLRFRFLLILFSYEAAKANFAGAGYTEDDCRESWRDIAHWASHYWNLAGDLLLEDIVFEWFFLHIAAELIPMGRLQFQLPVVYRDNTDLSPLVSAGDSVVELHIYEGAPLAADSCRESLRRLRRWLARYRPEYSFRAVIGHSWLFDPELARFLSEKSNILQFQKLGTIIPANQPSDILWRLFGGRDPREVANQSTLQKKIVEFYRQGGRLRMGYMVIPRETLENI